MRRDQALLLTLALLAAACAHRAEETLCVQPGGGLRYCLLPPEALASDGAPRLVHIAGDDVDLHLIAQLAAAPGELTFVASNLLGQPLFEIRYTRTAGSNGAVITTPDDAPVQSRWLLALLQLAQADAAAVDAALEGARVEIRGARRAVIPDGGEYPRDAVITVDSRDGALDIAVPARALRVRVQPLDAEDASW